MEELDVSAISNDSTEIQSSSSAETKPLTFVRVTVEDVNAPNNSQVQMRDVGEGGVVTGD